MEINPLIYRPYRGSDEQSVPIRSVFAECFQSFFNCMSLDNAVIS